MEALPLTKAEFDQHIAEGTFRLGFVGMSNVGKSYRAKVLQAECNFVGYHVDDEIQKSLGIVTIEELSEWLGYPYSPQYKEHEADYLTREARYTKVDFVDTKGHSLVFDTTGSVIYLHSEVLSWLKDNCLLVHLDAGEDALGPMIENFFEHPKPVIWGNSYAPIEGESHKEALMRCYPKLLHDRLAKYRALAHITIPATEFRDKNGPQTLEVIRSYLS